MTNLSKYKFLLMTVMLTILLISSAYAFLIPSVDAAELSLQDGTTVSLPELDTTLSAVEEKGLTILSNVLSLDMETYATASEEGSQDLYMDVVPEENVRYTLESEDSKVDMLCTFANGNLRMINVLEREGAPHMTKLVTKPLDLGNATLQVIDLVGTAKSFLSDHQSYSENAFYGELGSMLENVDADKNLTKTVGNVKLEVTVSEGLTVFEWIYTFNGMDAPDKCVALGYKDGFFKYFIDNWDLYKIGSTSVNLSEKEAIDIAMEHARAFSWNMSADEGTVKITNFAVTNAMIWDNVFASNLYADVARSEDPLMLYPVRHVWVSLDKYYPGNVYGIEVYIWADTKDVAHIQERFSTLDPSSDLVATSDEYTVQPLNGQTINETESNYVLMAWATFPVFAGITLGIIPVWLLLRKKKNLPKSFNKIVGTLLCVLVFSTIALVPISTVSAEDTRGALIFGSRSDGAMTEPPPPQEGWHWRKTAAELNRQGVTSIAIYNYFKDDGYATENHQGNPGSDKANVRSEITTTSSQHSLAAVVDFDHGVGNIRNGNFHYQFEDNTGTYVGPPPMQYANHPENGVYDYEIYSDTGGASTSKYFFTLINTCLSGKVDTWTYTDPQTGLDYPVGQGLGNGIQAMPFAWTHKLVTDQPTTTPPAGYMSRNGYTDPDSGQYAYMGFPFGSAALTQTITGISPIYATWLENFFWYALSFDISVNDALDEATLRNFNCLFGSSALATGFTANWPLDTDGDGVFEPQYGPDSTLVLYGNGNIHLYEYFVHDYLSATGSGLWQISNPDNIEGGSNDGQYTHMAAYYSPPFYSQVVLRCSIGWEATGHIYLYGYAADTSYVQVWVSPDDDDWTEVRSFTLYSGSPGWIDVGSYGSEFGYIAIVLYPGGNIYLDSVLVIPEPAQSDYYWVYSATEYEYEGGHVYNVEYSEGSYHDGNSAHIGCPNPPDRADIIGTLNDEVVGGGHVEIYGCSNSGYYSDMYVYVSSNNQDWYQVGSMLTITATSPYWIDVGTYGSSFRYIRIVGYDSSNSVALNIDCVRVT